MNVQDMLDDLVRSTSTYTESNLDTLSTRSLQVDSGGPIRHTKRKKYCDTKYAASTSTGTLKEHVKKHHPDIYKQKTKMEIILYNQQEQLEHNKYLINWIITIPNRHYISSCITRTFQNQRKNLNEDLQNISRVTIHWINSNWQMHKFLLDIIPFYESHTGANIANVLITLLIEYNLTTKIISLTTDNHSVMIVCGHKLHHELKTNFNNFLFSHQCCGAHILNLAVQHGLQVHNETIEKIRIFIKRVKKSNLLIEDLRRLFRLQNLPYLVNMLIAQYPDDFCDIPFTNNDWTNIYELISILALMYSATLSLSLSSFSTIGDFYFTFWTLKQKLEYEITNNTTQYIIADSICYKFDEYYRNINNTIKIATILDPHVKCSVYTFGEETNNAILLLRNKMTHYSTNTTNNTPNLTELSSDNLIFNQSNARTYLRNLANQFRPTTSIQPNINNELERYLAIPTDKNCDPLEWWKVYKIQFPILSAMAHDYLTIQATSVLCEQVFSIAGLTISKVRNRLDPETAWALLCLKSWIVEKIGKGINNANVEDIDIDDEINYYYE
ncbi:195_t:CDS:2 [Cetraspora pellucida]|uniref:195_t:CDS:1 n=1 Tax=Cetraspora pellucida TaxID=1433469 RepID=A0ACA9LT32_9GLOM|nr:195_t:CDS:2 [Cetraspora pellucida]